MTTQRTVYLTAYALGMSDVLAFNLRCAMAPVVLTNAQQMDGIRRMGAPVWASISPEAYDRWEVRAAAPGAPSTVPFETLLAALRLKRETRSDAPPADLSDLRAFFNERHAEAAKDRRLCADTFARYVERETTPDGH